MKRRNAGFARLLVVGLCLGVTSCAPYPGAQISKEPDGSLRVHVQEAQSFNALARYVYDDAQLGPALAELAGLDYAAGVPAASTLVLPPKEVVRARAEATKRVSALAKDGEKAFARGDFEKAAEKYAKALEIRPERSDLLLDLGLAQMSTGDLDRAAATLDQAARARPNDPEARYGFASVLRSQGLLTRARGEYEAALQALVEGDTHPRATYEYARTLEDLDETEKAVAVYRQFLYEFPADPWAEDVRRRLDRLSPASSSP